MKHLSLVFILICATSVKGWGSDEMEIFDLVEEINENFYTLLAISQDATLQEIKKAFRNASIIFHPDKNDAEDANIKFRNIVSVYEVLKDTSKREKYDKVLKEGLPNWKSALYYYRRVRKVGLIEMTAILFVLITIGQYFVAWAAYFEKKFTAEQLFGSKIKKLQKKSKTNVDLDAILAEIPSPSVKNTLPFQIPILIYNIITGTPGAVKSLFTMYAEQKQMELEQKQREQEEIELQKQMEEERIREKENRGLRRRNKKFVAPEKTDEELASYTTSIIKNTVVDDTEKQKPIVSGGLWTEEDLVELVKLVKKYPGGTTDRWEIIAEHMYRTVSEVTYMAAKMKDNGYKVASQQPESVAETIILEANKKSKTKKVETVVTETSSNWSQTQQQALETAIQKYPKSASTDRWQKIANSVPGKTKEECMSRYKYLVDLVKKQKEKEKEKEQEVEVEVEDNEEEIKTISDDNDNQKQIAADNAKGKSKNKRRERKKNIEYYSYEDSEESD